MMPSKKTVILPIAIILALSLTGVAYALWHDYIYIEGVATMGTLNIVWDEDEVLLPDEPGEYLGKDVAQSYQWYDPDSYVTDHKTGKSGYKTMIFSIVNAYPCYTIHFDNVKVHNIGTTPVNFVSWTVTGFDVKDGVPLVFEWEPGYDNEWGYFKDDVDGDGDLEEIIELYLINFIGDQLDPCHWEKGEIDFHFLQEAEECHTYTFSLTLEAWQWNEYIP
jgi:hypothetical protein